MSKVSNAINMYLLLQVRDVMKVSEIAEALEVTPRMVKEYKKDLEMAGINIGSKLGKYGGYYLENKRKLDGLDFDESELSALKMANETIKSGKYHYTTKFELLVSKILNSRRHIESIQYHNKTMKVTSDVVEKEKRVWVDINLAINQSRKVKMKYKSLKKNGVEITERLADPYGIFDYKGATYFYGYCEKAKDIRFFKLSRIIEYDVTKEKFEPRKDFDFKEVLDKSFGIYNDETVVVKLKINYPMSEIVKEQQISENQTIEQIDDKTIYFQAEMKGYTEIKTWIMGMGANVEVISPLKLRNDILKEMKEAINLYK